jgi:hypothetical protein
MNWRSWTRAVSVFGVALAAVAVPAGATPALAAAPGWQLVGPNAAGGHLAFTAVMPSRLYVLPDTGRSVYRTDDHGLTWQLEGGLGPAAAVGNRIAADPQNANVVYVAATAQDTGAGTVFRSDDGARTFRPLLDSAAQLTDVVVSSSGRQVFAAGDAGVFASDDSGRHWRQLAGVPSGVSRIGLSGDDLLGTATDGLYLIENALTAPKPARQVSATAQLTSLSVDGAVAVASNLSGATALSTDHGRHWAPLRGPWGADDALTFTGMTATGDLEVQSVAGSADGTGAKNFWISGDRGRTWRARPAATAKVDLVTEIGSFPDRPGEQVVAGPAGIYTTRDAVSFQRIGVPSSTVESIAVIGPSLVAGTTSGSYRSTAPLLPKLPPGYQDWGRTGDAPDTIGNTISALVPVPGTGAAALRVRNAFCGLDCFALERSKDGGSTWESLTMVDGHAGSLVVDPANPRRVYAGSYLVNGIYASDDGGSTLVLHQTPGLEGVRALAVDPRTPGALWIGDTTGLYRSTDGGVSASKVFDGSVNSVAVDPADPRHLVVAGDRLLEVSRDGGRTFTGTTGLPAADYRTVAFGPGGAVFAGSDDLDGPAQGVLRSTDGGRHWTNLSAALANPDVYAVVASPDGRWLFAGTEAGVYRLALS